MTPNSTAASFKERCEGQVISELIEDEILAGLFPTKQMEDVTKVFPRLSVNVTPGKEISPGAGIFNASGVVTIKFKYPDNSPDQYDLEVGKIFAKLSQAQARGSYGLILDGERPGAFSDHTTRTRTVAFRIIAG